MAHLVIRNLKGLRSEDAAPAEGARLDARHAGLERGGGGGATFLVRELLLRGKRHVKQHLRNKVTQLAQMFRKLLKL